MRVRSAALLLGLSLSAGPGAAAVISYTLDDHIAGLSPRGPAPWATVTIADTVADHVNVTITITGLSGSEFLDRFYLNFDPTRAATGSVFIRLATRSGAGASSFGVFSTCNAINGNCVTPHPDAGGFDLSFSFLSSGNTFTDGESYSVDLSGSGLSADDFAFANEKGFNAVARVGGMGTAGAAGIGYVGAAAVPETGTLALLGLGLAGLAATRRRRRKQ